MARFTKNKIAPAEPAVDKEMSDLGAVAKVRFGLASKFTAPVTLVISCAICLMGYVVYGSASESLEFQFNQQGVFAARIAATPEIDSWDDDYNTYQNLSDRIGAIDAELALAGAGTGSDTNTALTPEAVKQLRETIKGHDKAQRNYNLTRLRKLIKSKGANAPKGIYLDLIIFNASGKWKAKAGDAKSYERNRGYTLPSSPKTEIRPGTYTTSDGSEPARFFSHPIQNKDGAAVGRAMVVFSGREIRRDLNDLKASILIFCVLGVLACAGVAFITSKIFTRPLSSLMRDIKAVADGDLEHRTRKRSNDELGALAVAIDHMTKNLAAAEVMRVDLADKEHQVNLAGEVQERLFPQKLPKPPGLALDAGNRLASELSADLFDAVELEDGRIALLVMTSSGRGVPAAIVLSMARSLFRSRAIGQPTPADGLKAINELLAPDLRRGMYVSALYAIVDPQTGEGSLASAGHRVPALHFVADKGGLRKITADGIAIGLDKGPVFDRSLTETPFELSAGDRLVLATEGAFLLQDASGNPLGEEALMRVVVAGCKKGVGVAPMLSTLETKLGAQPGEHDVTLVMAMRS
ncbi:MAG: hypothetical protein CMJ83_00455 [Planctomycetes bacterium]|nr:hypothetical protein [Planctomycetota bacterium]